MNRQQECANRGLMKRGYDLHSEIGFELACEARADDAVLKDPADSRDVHRIRAGKKAFADHLREAHKMIRRALENSMRDRIASLRSLPDEPRETRHARARIIFGVELPAQSVEIRLASGLQQERAKQRRRTPLLIHSQRGAHRFTHNAPCAPFIAERVSPAARSGHPPRCVPSHRDGPRPGDRDDPRLIGMRGRQRDGQVIRHNQFPAFQECAEYFLLSVDAACESQARGIKLGGFRRNSSVPASFRYGTGNCFDQTRAPLRAFDMVRLTTETRSKDTAGRIANHGLRCRLATIDAEVQLARF